MRIKKILKISIIAILGVFFLVISIGFIKLTSIKNNSIVSLLEKQGKEIDNKLKEELNKLIAKRASKIRLIPLKTLPIISEDTLGELLIPLVKDDFEQEIKKLSIDLEKFVSKEVQKIKLVRDTETNIQNYENNIKNIKSKIKEAINKGDLLEAYYALNEAVNELVNVPVPKSYFKNHQELVFSVLLRYFIIKELTNEQENVVRKVLLQGIAKNLFSI